MNNRGNKQCGTHNNNVRHLNREAMKYPDGDTGHSEGRSYDA